ncbi:MAG: TonB-dependent receptor plug domain-containing protein [Longimicrobiales bacterium]
MTGRITTAALGWILLSMGGGSAVHAQDPADTPPTDTVPADAVPPDEVSAETPPSDTIPADALVADTLSPDTLVADTVVLEHFPPVDPVVPLGVETGIWEWDREELLGTRAITLSELLEEIPGIVPLRAGDAGMPRSASFLGSGGGGVRVFRDGIEFLPMEGSVPDLSRISVSDVESVRVVRRGEGLEIHLRSLRADDPRPYSRIEAGTGDLETNLLEGVFFHPRALGGNAGVSLHRLDTQGPRRAEPGAATSVKLNYTYLRGERFGLRADLARSITDRGDLYEPRRVNRTDWSLLGRWSPGDQWVGELFWNRASVEADTTVAGVQSFPFRASSRSQWGGRIVGAYGPVSTRITYRNLSGDGLPGQRLEARAAVEEHGWGGVAASWEWGDWSPGTTTTLRLQGWTEPLYGVSAFGSLDDFEHGVPALSLALPADDSGGTGGTGGSGDGTGGTAGAAAGVDYLPAIPGFSRGTSSRLGGRFQWRGLDLSGAGLRIDRSAIHPLGLSMDRGGIVVPGGERVGFEGTFRIPVPILDGLALEGSAQLWEEGFQEWPYFPRRTWKSGLSFHDTFFPTGNLEVWADAGVDGRDAMSVIVPREASADPPAPASDPFAAGDLEMVPSYQSWYARLQIRVVTVRVFVRWENFTFRDTNRDFPGRTLPTTRVLYGIRWTLWN